MQAGFLEELKDYTFLSETDFDIAAGDWIRAHDPAFMGSISGPKKSKEFRAAIEDKKSRIKRGSDTLGEYDEQQSYPGQDEKSQVDENPRKKRKTSKKASLADEAEDGEDNGNERKRKTPQVNGIHHRETSDAQENTTPQPPPAIGAPLEIVSLSNSLA